MSILDLAKALPTPIFDNATELDALFFNTLDQHGNGFHVVVAKTAFRIGAPDSKRPGYASLSAIEPALPLATQDTHLDNNFRNSTLQESDLAPYKPACDVMVIADAFAPAGYAVPQFSVQLMAFAAPLYDAGGNSHPQPERLINKHLFIHGPRQFVYRHGAWQLDPASTITQLPVLYEYAAGGGCMVLPDSEIAHRVPASERLPEPDPETGAIAWQVAQTNPVGMGFCPHWYWQATQLNSVAAPQIEYAQRPITLADFERCMQGNPMPPPAGFGAIGRAWLPRRKLVGQVEQKNQWQPDDVPQLPKDFDFAYWNAAPQDQQCRHLTGGEALRLVNLCPPDHPASVRDQNGNQIIDIELPPHSLALLVALEGDQGEQLRIETLVIDTVLINMQPEGQSPATIELTWRIALPVDTDITRLRLLHITEAAQRERLAQLQQVASMKVN
jgi:hypothetical protein